MAPSQFLFINSEIFGQHSVGIDTAFATMSDTETPNFGVLVQATGKGRAEGPDLPLPPEGGHGLHAGQVPPDCGHSWPLYQEEGGGLADRGGHEEAEGSPAPGQGQGP